MSTTDRLRRFLAVLLVTVLGAGRGYCFPAGQQTYFVLGAEHQVMEALSAIAQVEGGGIFSGGLAPSASSFVSMSIPAGDQVILYDHGEDGYEPDYAACLAGSCAQASTQVWGDGNLANGRPPGDADDIFVTNQVLNLESSPQPNAAECADVPNVCDVVPIPRVNTDVRFDGLDVVFTVGQPVNLVHVVFPGATLSGASITVIGGTWENFPVEAYDDNLTYTVPAGIDTYTNTGGDAGPFRTFKHTIMLVQATQDDTPVIVDNGTTTVSFVLDKGQSWSSRGLIDTTPGATATIQVNQNTTVTGGKPLQVGLITGATGTYQTRFFNIIPTGLYASEYMVPVFSRTTGGTANADVIINNPNGFSIQVTAQDTVGTTVITVPANSPASYQASSGRYVPENSGLRLTSSSLFWGIGAYDVGSTAGDWGYALQPNGFLNRAIACAHGPGNRAQVEPGGGGAADNGSPIWIAPVEDATTFRVDWNGDGTWDAADINNDGVTDGTSFLRNALQALTLYDVSDNDQTGAIVEADGKFVSAWGYRETGATDDPGGVNNLDWGYAINPFDFRFQEPVLTVTKVADPATVPALNGITTFTICASSGILVPVQNQDIVDELPPYWEYVPGSAVITYQDQVTVPLEPAITGTLAGGYTLTWDISETLNTREEVCVAFQAQTAYTCPAVSPNVTEDWQTPGTPGATSYQNGTGWTGNWTETGETSNPVAGEIQVRTSAGGGACSNTNHLEFRGGRGMDVRRSVDLSGFCAPSLALSQRVFGLGGLDRYYVDASADGTNFTTLATYDLGDNSGGTCTAEAFDLTPYATANAAIRFRAAACTPSGSTISDDFSTGTYTGGSGWAGNWTDGGDGGNGTGDGDIRVITTGTGTCPIGSNHLRLDDVEVDSTTEGISRAADLSSFCAPQLAIDWRVDFNAADESYAVQASSDNGANWTTLQTWAQADEVAACTRTVYDLSAFRTANAMIRFIGDAQNDGGDQLLIDNVQISECTASATVISDDFSSGTYTGGTGWAGNWTDGGDGGSGTGDGNIRVITTGTGTCPIGSNHLRLEDVEVDSATEGISRAVDLSGFCAPRITFDWRVDLSDGNDSYSFQVSTNGGASWTNLDTWDLGDEVAACTSSTYDLTSFRSSNAMIRFAGDADNDGGDFLFIDNIVIDDAGPSGLTAAQRFFVDDLVISETSSGVAPASVDNLARSSGTFQGFPFGGSATATVYLNDLRLTKTVDKAQAQVGEVLTYQITYQNLGGGAITGISVTDSVPAFTTLVGGSISSAPAVSATTSAGAKSVTWDVGTVNGGASGTLSFQVTVNQVPFDQTPIPNSAVALIGGSRIVNSNEVVTLVRTPIFQLLKEAPGAVSQGANIPFDFQFYNHGGAGATGVVFTDRIPANTDFVVGSAVGPGTIQLSNDNAATFAYVPAGAPGTADAAVTHIRFNIGSMAPTSLTTIAFTARVEPGTPANTVIRNFGFLTNDQTTVRTTNITQTVVTDLLVSLDVDADFACPRAKRTWTLSVGNASVTTPFTNVVIVQPIPTNSIYDRGSTTAPAGWTIEFSTDDGASYSGTEPVLGSSVTHLRFTRATLSPLASFLISFETEVDPLVPAGASVIGQASVTSTETGSLVISTNRKVLPTINVRIVKSADVLVQTQGDEILWTLTVQNIGAAPAQSVTLRDTIQGYDTFEKSTLVGGSISGGGSFDGTGIDWSLGTLVPLAPPLSFSFRTTVNATASSGDVITNLAQAESLVCTAYSNPVQVQVAAPGVTAGPDSVFWGDQLDVIYYPAIITNTGATTDTMEITFSTLSNRLAADPSWASAVSFYFDRDGDGAFDSALDTLLTDTGGAATVDTGPIAPGASLRILVRIVIPDDPPVLDGDTNATTVTATSTNNGTLSDAFVVTTNVLSATSVRLGELAARGAPGGVQVSWATFSEFQNLGFRVARSTSPVGPWEDVGCCLIPGVGTFQGRRDYATFDGAAPADGPLWYRVTDYEATGRLEHHGPVAVDRDGDGLGFVDELRLDLSDQDPTDGAADPDGDGMSTAAEVAVGRDPFVSDAPDSRPAVSTPQAGTPPPQGIRVVEEDEEHQVLELVLWDYRLEAREVDGRSVVYPKIDLPVSGTTEDPGRPQLPVVGTMLPPGFTGFTVQTVSEEERSGVEVGPAPVPREVESGTNLLSGYRFDPGFYDAPPGIYPDSAVLLVPPTDPEGHPRLVFRPFGYDHAGRRLFFRPRIRVEVRKDPLATAALALVTPAAPGLSSLPPGTVYRLRTRQPGLFRLSGSDLGAAGISLAGVDPRNLSLYRGGDPVAIRISGESDGVFDPGDVLEFYSAVKGDRNAAGEGYHLLLGSSHGLRWGTSDLGPAEAGNPRRFYSHTETRSLRQYYYGPLPGEAHEDRFVGGFAYWAFPGTAGTTPLALDVSHRYDRLGGSATLTVTYGAPLERDGNPDHHHLISFDGRRVADGTTQGSGFFRVSAEIPIDELTDGPHTVSLGASLEGLPPSPRGEFLVLRDASLTYRRKLVAEDGRLEFGMPAYRHGARLEAFPSPDVTVLDVTFPDQPRMVPSTTDGSGPYEVDVPVTVPANRRFFAYVPEGALGIAEIEVGPVTRTDLRASGKDHRWVAVVPAGWEASLDVLVQRRAAQGLKPLVVSMQDLADEFTGGVIHQAAIRRLLDHARRKWARVPDYLLLAGDTHVNPRRYPDTTFGLWDTEVPVGVPTRMEFSGPDLYGSESGHDTWYGKLVGNDDLPEVAVGRIPAGDPAELAAVAAKIVAYEAQPLAPWTRELMVVSDDGEPLFEELSEGALGSVPPGMGIQRYHRGDLDTFPNYATYKAALDAGLDAGALMLQFVGHGSQNLWADTTNPTLQTADVAGMGNALRAPLVLSFTCNDGYFTAIPRPDKSDRSLAEAMVLAPSGGAVAYLASGVQSTAAAKDLMHRSWMQSIFAESRWRIGDAQRRALAAYLAQTSDPERLARAFHLFGDPATVLKMPLPKPPSGIKAVRLDTNTVKVTWTRSTSSGITGYEVYRRLGTSPSTLVGTTPRSPTEFFDVFPEGVPTGEAAPYYTVRTLVSGGLGSAFPVEVQSAGLTAAAPGGGENGGGGGCSSVPGATGGWPLALLLLPWAATRGRRRTE